MTDDLQQIRAYATHVIADCSGDHITHVQSLGGGENHSVYKLSYLDPDHQPKDVVVRIASSERARNPAAAEREATALKMAQRFVAPLLHDFRCDSEWFDAPVMCMDFVEGEQRAPRDAQEFERLGDSVGWVHGLPTQNLAEWFPDEPSTQGYLQARLVKIREKVPSIRDPLPVAVQDRLRWALAALEEAVVRARRSESFETNESLVLLHGDVAGGNIVWTPSPVLIDWEYARVGDPADEIAYIFAQHDCTPEQRTMFWRGYRQRRDRHRAPEHVVDRAGWWEPITILGSALFWVQLWSRRADADAAATADPSAPREQVFYREETIRRLNRFEALLGRLQSWWRCSNPHGKCRYRSTQHRAAGFTACNRCGGGGVRAARPLPWERLHSAGHPTCRPQVPDRASTELSAAACCCGVPAWGAPSPQQHRWCRQATASDADLGRDRAQPRAALPLPGVTPHLRQQGCALRQPRGPRRRRRRSSRIRAPAARRSPPVPRDRFPGQRLDDGGTTG